jgi:hypothetical protein
VSKYKTSTRSGRWPSRIEFRLALSVPPRTKNDHYLAWND